MTRNKIEYWDVQRKGTNYFNQSPSASWLAAAKETGIQFARLAPDKWKAENRDFLIGNADSFVEISAHDLKTLKDILDQAQQHDIKIILTFLSLPGSRWKQNNQNNDDLRIWQYKQYHDQACLFWKTVARALKDHPAIVGYNIVNEPHPEQLCGISDYSQINFYEWYGPVKGTLADLNLFYKNVVRAIREVDPYTPIVLDTGLYATPWAINYLIPLEDAKIIYSFHMYEPYAFTTRKINKERFSYPGNVPIRFDETEQKKISTEALSINWNFETCQQFFHPILSWQEKYHIPSSRILVGEFGCDRRSKGANEYLANLITIFNSNHWHWAFYSFREDCWDSMDYELGSGKLDEKYWEAVEQEANLDAFRKDNGLFDVIKHDLKHEDESKFDYATR